MPETTTEFWTVNRLFDVHGDRVVVVQPQRTASPWGEVALLLDDGTWRELAGITMARGQPGTFLAKHRRFVWQPQSGNNRACVICDTDLEKLVADLVRLDDRWSALEYGCSRRRVEKLVRKLEPVIGRDVAVRLALEVENR